MPRQQVTETALIEKIRKALHHRDDACSSCNPEQLGPVKATAGGINWQLLSQTHNCSDSCQAQMLEICKRLADEYDVDWA